MKALCEDHYACYITSPQELYMQIRDKNTIKNSQITEVNFGKRMLYKIWKGKLIISYLNHIKRDIIRKVSVKIKCVE